MDYKRIYNEFIADRRAKESTLTGYTEKHHILPRSLGGSDDANNLIKLTAGDHVRAHILLAKIYNGRLWFALAMMLGGQYRVNHIPTKIEQKASEIARNGIAKIKGEFHHRFGVKHTQKTRKKISKRTKERMTEEVCKKISESCKALGQNHPSKRDEIKKANGKKVSAALLSLGDKHPSKRPEFREMMKGNKYWEKHVESQRKKIINLDTNEVFESMTAAAKNVGKSPSCFCKLRSRSETFIGGYRWAYYKEAA